MSNDAPDLRAERIEALRAARAAIDRELVLLGGRDDDQAPSIAQAIDEPDWGTIGEASGLFQRSAETTAKRVAELGLGVFENGRWRVDLNRVRAHLATRPYVPLEPYAQRDSGKFGAIRGNSE